MARVEVKVVELRAVAATLLMILGLLHLVACQTLIPAKESPSTFLRTDSAEIGVRFNRMAYSAKIGFVYVNNTGKPVSRAGCGGPGSPNLEKKIDGHWVQAYAPVSLLCRSIPDFALESGASYRGVLDFLAFQAGHHSEPTLIVDSIDGVYRLRWDFTEGREAGARGARKVEAISNEFRMLLR